LAPVTAMLPLVSVTLPLTSPALTPKLLSPMTLIAPVVCEIESFRALSMAIPA